MSRLQWLPQELGLRDYARIDGWVLFPFDVPESGVTEGDEEDTSATIEDLAGSSTDEDEAVAEDEQWEGAVETDEQWEAGLEADDTDEVCRHDVPELLPAEPDFIVI